MFLDALLKISASQQVTADAVSTNCIDIGALTAQRKIGVGEPMVAIVAIKAIGTTTGSTKLQVIQSATEGLGAGTQILGEIDLATADIAAGKIYKIAISAGIPGLRYLGMNHDITGTVDYTVDAFIAPASMASIIVDAYAKGYVNA